MKNLKGIVETIETCFEVEILACRIKDEYLLVKDIDTSWNYNINIFWINPDYITILNEVN